MKRKKQRGMSSGRVLAGMLVFCMAVGTAAGQTGLTEVRAAEVQQEEGGEASAQAESDFRYRELQDGTIEISGYTGTNTEVIVPDEIGGKKVTSIGYAAFYRRSSLMNITLPEGLTSIGEMAFYGCNSLANITLPGGLTSIGKEAFYGCSSLTSITLPEGITSIGSHTFYGCSNLTNITFPKGLTSIGLRAFESCSSLTNIMLPEGLTSIDGSTFEKCSSLTNITLPEGLTSIGSAAFNGCSSLTDITLPEGLTNIGVMTFYGCSSLANITLPKGLTSIGERAFYGCSSLTNLVIPKGVTDIGAVAFHGCTNLNVTVPASLTEIRPGSFIFQDVASVQFEEGSPFTAKDGIIYKNNTILMDCYNVKEGTVVTIPDGVTCLGKFSFYGLFPIDVIVPTSVTSIAGSGLGDQGYKGIIEHYPANIYYTGSEDQWQAIEGYDEIASYEAEGWVIMHYNYAPTSAPTPDTPSTPQGVQSEANTSSVSIAMSQEALADAVLTAEEKQLLAEGAAVKVSLNVADATNTVSDADKAAVAAALGGYTLGQYLDISLSKTVNGNTSGVSETMAKLTLTIQVPEALKNTDANKIRRFAVIRIHNGQAELLKDKDDKEDTITIESDRFSTYAVVYQDEAKKQSPKTGAPGTGTIFYGILFVMLLVAGGIGIFCARRKREE